MSGIPAAAGPSTDVAAPSGGEQLRRARQSLNLALGEVARRLRLKPEVLIALEGGRFQGMAPAYVRGYLRGYARIVGLDPDTVVSACAAVKDQDVPVTPCRTTSEVRALGDTNRPLRFGTYAVVTVLGLLLAASWRAQYAPLDETMEGAGEIQPEAPTEPADTAEQATPNGLPYRFPIIHHPEQLPKPVDEVAPASEAPEAIEQTPSRATPPQPAEEPQPRDGARLPFDQGARLVLELGEDSWAEVKDAYGAKLYYNLAVRGQTITLGGQAPLSVVLGNASGVAVFYDGKLIDIGPWSRGGVARFKVGEPTSGG